MANISGSKFKGQIGSVEKELGSNAMVLEILERVGSSSAIVIYGKENSTGGSDDLQVIGHIVSYIVQEHIGVGGDNRFGTIASHQTTNDRLTITCTTGRIYHIWVLGYPGKA